MVLILKIYNASKLDLIHREKKRKLQVCEMGFLPATEADLLSRSNSLRKFVSSSDEFHNKKKKKKVTSQSSTMKYFWMS